MKTVLVHGCFDLIHCGHIQHFEAAKAFGDRLVVSVTTDRFVAKGPGRPVFSVEIRAKVLRALAIVDDVIISDYPTAVQSIQSVKPDFYVKGPDYKDLDTPDLRSEIEAVESVGGKFVCTDEPTYSSSTLANRFFVNWTEDQQRVINQVKELGGMEAIEAALQKIKNELNVLIVGECIWDVYRFVKPENLSSKSPTISAKIINEESYQGGAWAITKHIMSFCKVSQVLSGKEHDKIRYISEDNGQRLFEVTDIQNEIPVKPEDIEHYRHNLLLVADFGHGLIPGTLTTKEFKALNVQTNSSNYGFNSLKKHKSFDYLVCDLRELRLAYQDKTTDPCDLGLWASLEYKRPIAVTLGKNGSAFFLNGETYKCPAFCDNVVDAIGAGDAFLAITSLLVRTKAHPVLVGFLGNVFAGLKAKILGNKMSVTKESLIRTCAAILK